MALEALASGHLRVLEKRTPLPWTVLGKPLHVLDAVETWTS
jgi:hypothetical protein